jgi:erythromycin esterase-like protein
MTSDIEHLAHAVDAPSVLGLLPTRPRILALGEPPHGEDVLLDVRNGLFRALVEQEGYRTIALESDGLRGLLVDDHVTSGTGTLDEVMAHGFSHGFGASPANRELVRWMRAYNEGRPASEQVRFAGLEGPLELAAAASPRQALTALHAYLAARVAPGLLPCTAETLDDLLGPDDRWSEPAAMMDPSRSAGRTPEAERLRLLADDLVTLLDTQTPHLFATSSRDGWDRARLYGRAATGLLRYHSWMADASPSRLAGLLGVRTSMIAANLLTIAERAPVLAYAHNSHFQRPKSTMRLGDVPAEWWSAGAIADARLREDYAFVAMALGTIRHRGVDVPPADTVEGRLYALERAPVVVDARRLAATVGNPPPRVSPWFGYAPLDPAHLTSTDGVVFVRDAAEGRSWWPVP